jgi:hypothetical protein
MILSDFIWPDTAVARSVNVERDMGDGGTLRQYHLTDKGLEIISRLVSARAIRHGEIVFRELPSQLVRIEQ